MIDFFTKEEGDRIVEAIRLAELRTSGEIRVHLEVGSGQKTIREAVKIFAKLGMKQTKDRNGVLFLLVPEKKEFSIYGDVGIHKIVPEGYWEDIVTHVEKQFRLGAFTDGVCEGIQMVGEKLKMHFPYKTGDENELPNQISYGQ